MIPRPFAVSQSRSQQVYETIRDSICSGELASLAQAHRWYKPEAYAGLRRLRVAATTSSAYFVPGPGQSA